MAGEAADFAVSAGVLAQLSAAAAADAEAAKIATAANVSLAQAKSAVAAAAQQAAASARAEQAAQRASADAAKAAAKEAIAAQDAKFAAAKSYAKFVADAAEARKKEAKEAADQAKEAANAQKEAAQSWKDSGDLMTSPIDAVKKALNGLGPEGQAAAVAIGMATIAVTALTGAILGGMAAAIGVVERMTERLSIFSALGGSAAAGKATLDMVGKLSEKLPFTTAQLSEWAEKMQRAGRSGKDLETAVKAIAAAAALNPKGGAEAAQNILDKLAEGGKGADTFLKTIAGGGGKATKLLHEMGLNLTDIGTAAQRSKMNADQLAKAIERALIVKGAGPLAAMGNTWAVISEKAKSGLMSIFSGLSKSVEPFMASVKSLFAMFNKGGPMVAILKPIITSVFGTLFSWATKAVSFVHGAFQQLVIAGLKVRIAVQPIVVAVRELWAELQKAATATGLFSGKSSVMSAALGILKTIVVGTFQAAVMGITGFIRALAAVVGFVTMVVTKIKAIFKGFSLPNLAGAAGTMITSFIAGITGKLGSVVASMMAMGAAAKKGLLSALGIASPSKVALEAAGNVTSSFADKVDDGKPAAQKAFSGLVKPPPGTVGSGTKAAGNGGALAAAVERLATVLEASPGWREMIQQAMQEAEQEGAP